MTVNDVSIILGIVIPIISMATGGIWMVVKRNGERSDKLAESFRTSVEDLAAEFRKDTKLITDQLHERISRQREELSEFRITVAKQHPDRNEMNQAIDNAVAPMLRELQHVRDQVTSMNNNLTQFIQQQNNDR